MTSNFQKRLWYVDLRHKKGFSIADAAKEAGLSLATAYTIEKEAPAKVPSTIKGLNGKRNSTPGREYEKAKEAARSVAPIPHQKLKPEAKRALEDFSYMQRRYLGRIPVPWQADAAQKVIEYLESPDKEYVVINAPPGSGKSTTFTLDIALWITIRNRAIRGLIGSFSKTQATWYTGRLRRTLEARVPLKAEPVMLEQGLAVDAESTFIKDFGRFRPDNDDIWRRDEFTVEQMGGQTRAEKEATWSAFGMDSAFLGGRYDIVLWDDVYLAKKLTSWESKEAQRKWWIEEAETRLEPSGLLVLQGQRMEAEDLYHFALEQKAGVYDDEDEEETERVAKYRHIVYKAHYDEKCKGKETHGRNAPPYPEGCLLYPARLPWRELSTQMQNYPEKFRILYQQEDVDPEGVLVNPLWVSGGTDSAGNWYPGCWDSDREAGELPPVMGETVRIVSVDPSPTQYWSVQDWMYHPESEFRYLIDHVRKKMEINEFLTWDLDEHRFKGLMEDWQTYSEDIGRPIQYWIIEVNAAARFMTQADTMKRWMAKHGVNILPHTTHRNKTDAEYGVQSLANVWKFGKVRLPGSQAGNTRLKAMKLVEEVTRCRPDGSGTKTNDAVMAEWFFEWNLPKLYVPNVTLPRKQRPSWMQEAS